MRPGSAEHADQALMLASSGDVAVPSPAGQAMTQSQIGQLLWPQTAAEAAAGIVPSNWTQPPLYVERYGADPTGVADSGVAFRAACAVAAASGGGRIYALGAVYHFTTWDPVSFYSTSNLALFCVPRNTELVGGGMFATKLRISSTARSGMYAGGAHRTHIIGMRAGQTGQYIHDLQFDYGGIVQAAATDHCYFVRTLSGGCVLERLHGTQAPITNAIVDNSGNSGEQVVVRYCWFYDCGPNMTGNTVNVDCTYVYLQAPDSIAEYNRIYNTSNALHNCGGIEMHSNHYTARNNFLKNLWPAMYLGVEDSATISVGSIVECNYFGFGHGGLSIIDRHTGLKITRNHFEANADVAAKSTTDIYTRLNGATGVSSSGVQTALTIVDNTFDCTLYRTGIARGLDASQSINLCCVKGGSITRNSFMAPTGAVAIQGSVTAPSLDLVVEDNLLVDVADSGVHTGFLSVLGDSGIHWGAGPVFRDIFIRRNKILRDRGTPVSIAKALVATGGGAFPASYTNIRFEDNDAVNIAAGVTITGAASVVTGVRSPT
jgi:hypothetical protein